jgi:hypothetical protein
MQTIVSKIKSKIVHSQTGVKIMASQNSAGATVKLCTAKQEYKLWPVKTLLMQQ